MIQAAEFWPYSGPISRQYLQIEEGKLKGEEDVSEARKSLGFLPAGVPWSPMLAIARA